MPSPGPMPELAGALVLSIFLIFDVTEGFYTWQMKGWGEGGEMGGKPI